MTTIPSLPFSGQQLRDTLAALDAADDGKVGADDARLSDTREWSATTISQAEAEAGTATTRRAFTAQRVFQSVAAWWAASAAKTKLDGIASGATANASDAALLSRANHTGTQSASTITGLGGAAALNVGTAAGTVAAGDDPRFAGGGGPTFTGYSVGSVVVPFSGVLNQGTAHVASQINLMPFYVERAVTIDQLSARITTAVAGSLFQLAFYNHANGVPTGNAFGATGSMSGGVADVVTTNIAPTTLQPMVTYWLASNADAAIVFLSLQASSLHTMSIVGAPSAAIAFAGGNQAFFGYAISASFNNWPDLTGATLTALSTNTRRSPAVAMRVSALP